MSNIKEIIVRSVSIVDKTYIDANGEVQNTSPETSYLVLNGDFTHERYVSDANNNISRQGRDLTDTNISLSNPLIGKNQAQFNQDIYENVEGIKDSISSLHYDNSGATEAIESEIDDIREAIDAIQGTITDISVGSISEALIFTIRQQKIQLDNEFTDVHNRYENLITNQYLYEKNRLRNAYNSYLATYNALISFINTSFSDNVITQSEKDQLNLLFANYRSALDTLSSEMVNASDSIASAIKGNIEAQIDYAVEQINTEIEEVGSDLGMLQESYESFATDGVFTIAEIQAIKSNIELLENEKADVFAKYNEIYGNIKLPQEGKDDLDFAWDEYESSHIFLIEKINSAVADGLSDTEEVSAVTAAFTTYRAKLALLSIAFEIAVSTIYGVMIEGLRGEINTEIGGIRDSITEINTAISDLPLGQISETALYGIRAQRNIIYNDYTELKTRYDIISVDLYSMIPAPEADDYVLINTQYTDLTGIYSQYEASFNTLYGLLETSFQDSYMTAGEKEALETALSSYRGKLELLSIELQKSTKLIDTKKLQTVEDRLQSNIDGVINDYNDINTDLGTLQGEFNTFSTDGVFTIAEIKAIGSYIQALDTEKADLDKRYEVVSVDPFLDGEPKNNLDTAYQAYTTQHGTLISLINTTISNGTINESVVTAINDEFDNYRNVLTLLTEAFEIALRYANEQRVNDLNDKVFDSSGYYDPQKIKPLSIETKHISIGDRMQRFSLPNIKFSLANNYTQLKNTAGTIVHSTIATTPRTWNIASNTISGFTTDFQYVYCQADIVGNTAVFLVTTEQITVEEVEQKYTFEVGYLSSPDSNGVRILKTTYGFAQINPAELSIGRISDPTGQNYIDLKQNGIDIVAKVTFKSGSTGYDNIGDKPDLSSFEATRDYVNSALQTDLADLKNRADGVIESWFYSHSPNLSNLPASNWTTNELKDSHIGDTFTNMQEFVDNTTTPDAGKAWRFARNADNSYSWNLIANSDSTKALIEAGKAKDTADSKRRVFIVEPTTPYDVGDLWTQGPTGVIMRAIVSRASGSFVEADWQKADKYTDDTRAILAQEAAKAYTDSQAILTKIMMESYMDGIISNAESLAITAAENALVDAYNRLLELSQNLASGGMQLLREYDIAFNFKYWGGTGTAGNIDVNNITVIEAFAMGGLVGATAFDYVDENGKKIEIIY